MNTVKVQCTRDAMLSFLNSLKPFDCPLGSRVAIERDKLEMVFANKEQVKKVNKNSNLVIMNNSQVWANNIQHFDKTHSKDDVYFSSLSDKTFGDVGPKKSKF
jgi:hypothetical protein